MVRQDGGAEGEVKLYLPSRIDDDEVADDR
jgi:hypothetical protein